MGSEIMESHGAQILAFMGSIPEVCQYDDERLSWMGLLEQEEPDGAVALEEMLRSSQAVTCFRYVWDEHGHEDPDLCGDVAGEGIEILVDGYIRLSLRAHI